MPNKMISLCEETYSLAKKKHDRAGGFSGWVRQQLLKDRTIEQRRRVKDGEDVDHVAWRDFGICWPYHPSGCCSICWPDGPPDESDWLIWKSECIAYDKTAKGETIVRYLKPPPKGQGWIESTCFADEIGSKNDAEEASNPPLKRQYIRRLFWWLWSWI